ncbi:arginine deiminase family protein [SAR92 clade bacterium H231]|nr:arginine deiminase family protein [SAR92 clade bacterium H231]
MFRNAILRTPCKNMINGLADNDFGKPNYQLALEQYRGYIDALKKCQVEVTVLPKDERYPDSCFIEDSAICAGELAVLTRPGAVSRAEEIQTMEPHLRSFFKKLERIEAPATLDGGDVMMVGRHFYIGLSNRTNIEGASQLIHILNKYGMSGSTIAVKNLLHLKTGIVYLENNRMLASPEFHKDQTFNKYEIILVANDEIGAANSLWVNDRILMPVGYPVTRDRLISLKYEVIEVDISEFQKLDGGLTCLSLRF